MDTLYNKTSNTLERKVRTTWR